MFSTIKKRIQDYNAKRELVFMLPKLNQQANGLGAEALVDLIFSDEWKRFFWIKQVRSEIVALCKMIEGQKPKTIIEIGTANGGSLFLFSKLAAPNAKIISIDLPEGKFGGGYSEVRSHFYRGFASEGQSISLLRGNSHHPETKAHLESLLKNQLIDFLFIDGDHTYDGVKEDFIKYSKLVASDGIVALHDIAVHGKNSLCKVNLFWEELKGMHSGCIEIIEDVNQRWAGIGVVKSPTGCLIEKLSQ